MSGECDEKKWKQAYLFYTTRTQSCCAFICPVIETLSIT